MARIPDHELERLKAEVSLERLAESQGIQLAVHGLGSDVDFADLGVTEQLVDDGQVVGDGVLDVAQRLFLGRTL